MSNKEFVANMQRKLDAMTAKQRKTRLKELRSKMHFDLPEGVEWYALTEGLSAAAAEKLLISKLSSGELVATAKIISWERSERPN